MRYGGLMIKPRKRPQEFNQAAQAGGRHRHVALPLGPHPDWDTVRRSTDLTRLDIDFREMGELSAFATLATCAAAEPSSESVVEDPLAGMRVAAGDCFQVQA